MEFPVQRPIIIRNDLLDLFAEDWNEVDLFISACQVFCVSRYRARNGSGSKKVRI